MCVLSAAMCGTSCKVLCDISSNCIDYDRQHLSSNDCLRDKREGYHICFTVYCLPQLCTLICTREYVLHRTNCLGLAFLLFN